MVIGVAVAITTKVIANMISGIPVWYGLGKTAVMGAVSGAISFGIGSAATSAFQEAVSIGKALFEAGMHALSGGTMSALDGGKFGAGALSGAVSSALSSSIQKLGSISYFGKNNPELLKAIMITSGGLSGGISASIAGGNFWQGFRQGIITSGLNHVAHLLTVNIQENNLIRKSFDDPDGKPEENMESVKIAYSKVKHLFNKSMINAVKAVPIDDIELDLNNTLNQDGYFDADTRWSNETRFNVKQVNGKNVSVIITGKIIVTLFKSSFTSWTSLGRSILHEYYHVADMRSQLYKTTYITMINKYSSKNAMSHFLDWNEKRAFKFIFSLGDTTSIYDNVKNLYQPK